MSQVVEEEFLGMTQESEEDQKEIDLCKQIGSPKSGQVKNNISIDALN